MADWDRRRAADERFHVRAQIATWFAVDGNGVLLESGHVDRPSACNAV